MSNEIPIEHRTVHTAGELLDFLKTLNSIELAGPVRLCPVDRSDEMTEVALIEVFLSDGSTARDVVLGSRQQ